MRRRLFRLPITTTALLVVILLAFLLVCSRSEGKKTEFDLNTLTLGRLRLLGDAHVKNGTLALTRELPVPNSAAGRALYAQPVRLVDPATRARASFSTNFAFSITNLNPSSIGAGLAFVLAPDDRTLGEPGAYLGLISTLDPPEPRIVAVEFDTCMDVGFADINGNHVGLDLGSLASYAVADLDPVGVDLKSGDVVNAWIDYDGRTSLLDVSISYSNLRPPDPILSVHVDIAAHLREYAFVGFSASTQGSTETHTIQWWSFASSLPSSSSSSSPSPSSSSQPPPPPPPPPPPTNIFQGQGPPASSSGTSPTTYPPPSSTGNSSAPSPHPAPDRASSSPCHNRLCKSDPGAVAGVVTAGAFVLVACAGLIIWFRFRGVRLRRADGLLEIPASEMVRAPREFSYRTLKSATRNFDSSRIIGHGAFGTVYKGVIAETGAVVAVKRCSNESGGQGKAEFLSELSIIGALRHRNLVQLLGWCHQKGEILLVYEFMPNGSLDKALFLPAPMLPWRHRRRILAGVASALAYLHDECEKQVIHRDVKASNIMLDDGFNAKLGDFGLARQIEHDRSPDATIAAGTMGYLAPEYVLSGRATDKTDVFSFGAVVLEVACGRRPIEKTVVNLVDWVWGLHREGRLVEAADVRLAGEFEEGEMRRVLLVGLICSHPDPLHRPCMRNVVQMLSGETSSPAVPRSKPSMSFSSNLLMNLQEDSASDYNGIAASTSSSEASINGGGHLEV
ncbi:L-type lectin-domain containing receptor kinase VIII.1-like [Nymphaea colorata]|nr:L-type lectin-domain containing receptor kinase VIII.1-like [Nymphaea colorata]